MIWEIWKKSKLECETIWYGKYGRKASWNVKWYGKYGINASPMVKIFGKYRRNLWKDIGERQVEMWNDMENME